MDGASMETYLEMLRFVKFFLDMKNFCLKICLKIDQTSWNIRVFCDSNWARDTETRISVTGFIDYLQGEAIGWLTHTQKEPLYPVVSLSILWFLMQ
jgi:hypothetical protein